MELVLLMTFKWRSGNYLSYQRLQIFYTCSGYEESNPTIIATSQRFGGEKKLSNKKLVSFSHQICIGLVVVSCCNVFFYWGVFIFLFAHRLATSFSSLLLLLLLFWSFYCLFSNLIRDLPPNSSSDPKVGPWIKQWKKKRIGACSLTCSTLRLRGCVGALGWTKTIHKREFKMILTCTTKKRGQLV
jgi:hypothetical protein